ncbi:MAG: zinc/manganese transport system substrate-binding protein [Alphaproteobacteria bacterium]|jgi:zinc/manganese transport system substrate-binding protein
MALINSKLFNFKFIGVVGLLLATSIPAYAVVNVFACEPEWEALAIEIGGDHIKVKTATNDKQDPHYLRAKPSLLAAMRRADLVFCSGADLEIGWLPILLNKAGGVNVQVGKSGYLMAADYVQLLDKPVLLDRSQGDVHAMGNPHVHLNPHNLKPIAKELSKRLSVLDVQNKLYYTKRLDLFLNKLYTHIKIWEEKAVILKEQKIISHHKSWSYLIDWLDLQLLETLEDKSGVTPTLTHLNSVLNVAKKEQPFVIIRSPYNDAQASLWLSDKSGISAKEIMFTVDGSSLFDLYDTIINELVVLVK